MQTDCDQMQLNVWHTNYLVRANHEATKVTQICNAIVIIGSIAQSGGPLIIMLSHYLRGTFHRDHMVLPFHGIYPFDCESWIGFTVAYGLNVLYNVSIGLTYSSITTLFVGLCLLTMGYMDNLGAHFTELDNKYEELDTNRKLASRHSDPERYLHDEIINGISEHHRLIEMLDMFAVSVSGIIFAQFTGNVIILSTFMFQASLGTGETMFLYALPCCVVMVDLFLFSYFGSRLTDKWLEVHDSIYQTKWYLYPIEEQRHIQLLLLRLQKPFILRGFGYVNCTLQSFVQVLQTVGSVLTLLQSVDLSK